MIFAINRDLIENCHSVVGSGLIIKNVSRIFSLTLTLLTWRIW